MKIISLLQKVFAFLLQPRVLAVVVLLILVVFPAVLYYLFMVRNTSSFSLEISSDFGSEVQVSLDGKLTNSWLPLLDRTFSYEKKCTKSCTFDPIPPATYSLSITHTGSNSISDTIEIVAGEHQKNIYTLVPKISLVPTSLTQNALSSDEKILLGDDIHEYLGEKNATVIDRDDRGRIFVFVENGQGSDIGTMSGSSFTRLHHFPFSIQSVQLDPKHQTFIIHSKQDKIYLASIGFDSMIEYTGKEEPNNARFNNTQWSIQTSSGVLTYERGKWRENMRFSDYIDLSQRYRIGYISRNDTKKLTLANYPKNSSQLLLLDRSDATIIPIDTHSDIEGIFSLNNSVYAFDTQGSIYKIQIPFSY